MERKQIKNIVGNIMLQSTEARDNDNYLIAKVLLEIYGTTDIYEIAEKTNEGICESITRCRRQLQKNNPFLASSPQTSRARRRKEQKFREELRREI